MVVDSPSAQKYSLNNMKLKQMYKAEGGNKKTGKKLFPHQFSATYSQYAPLQIESPPKADFKVDQLHNLSRQGFSNTMDLRYKNQSYKINSKGPALVICR